MITRFPTIVTNRNKNLRIRSEKLRLRKTVDDYLRLIQKHDNPTIQKQNTNNSISDLREKLNREIRETQISLKTTVDSSWVTVNCPLKKYNFKIISNEYFQKNINCNMHKYILYIYN